MAKQFDLKKYGMAVCPLCTGKGFFLKLSVSGDQIEKTVCVRCGGFGAVYKNINEMKDQEGNPSIWQ